MNGIIFLIRHAEVDPQWKRICYGQKDVPLSQRGLLDSNRQAQLLRCLSQPTAIYHSGLERTRYLAERIAEVWLGNVPVLCDGRLCERNYGQWEGRTWDEVFASDPDHFHDLIDRPDDYRPPGGETTTQMQQRVREWFDALPMVEPDKPIVAISHSGPIAALCGSILKLPAQQWDPWILGYLERVSIDQRDLKIRKLKI